MKKKKTNKNPYDFKLTKKKLLVPVIALVLFIGFFCLPIFGGRTAYSVLTYKDTYYATLSTARQAAYDKLQIKSVKITERKTGTENFNTDSRKSVDDGSVLSNMEGIDVSEKDNYVRTFDKVFYTIEVEVEKNPNKTTNAEVIKGGVIKVKAKIPKGKNGENFGSWNYDAWMNNRQTTDSYTTITAEYYVPEEQSIAGGNQQLSFSFTTNGYVQKLIESGQKPTFEVWMEGNKPDNTASTATSKSITDSQDIYISGKENYEVEIIDGATNLPGEENGQKGQYINFGIQIMMKQPYSYVSQLKGVSYPSFTNATAKVKIEYYYNNINDNNPDWTLIDNSNKPKAGLLNGGSLIAYNYTGSTNSKARPFPSSNNGVSHKHAAQCGRLSSNNSSSLSVCSDPGIHTATLKENILEINYANMEMPDVNSNTHSFSSSSTTISSTFLLSSSLFELFIPYYNGDTKENEYQVKVIATEFTPKDGNNKNNLIPDSNSSNDSRLESFLVEGDPVGVSFTFYKNISGGSYRTSEDMFVGGSANVTSIVNGNFGIYKGGVKRLITWNPSFFDLNYASKTVVDSAKATIQYGVYKSNKENGLLTQKEMNTTTYDDFTWYTNYNEAKKNGKITAIFFDDRSWQGYGQSSTLSLNFSSLPDLENVGKVTMMRQKTYIYADEARTKEIKLLADDTENSYIPTKYEGDIKVSAETPAVAGETIYMYTGQTNTTIRTNDFLDNGTRKTNYDVLEEVVNYSITSDFLNSKELLGEGKKDDVYITVQLPKDLEYYEASTNINPERVHKLPNGITYVTWLLKDVTVGDDIETIDFSAGINPYIANNSEINVKVYIAAIKNSKYSYNSYTYDGQSYQYPVSSDNNLTIYVSNLSGSVARKTLTHYYIEKNESTTITDTVYNISENRLNNVKTIQRLPYNKDNLGSNFTGTYTIKVNRLAEEQKLYYSTASFDTLNIPQDSQGNLSAKNINFANDSNWIEVAEGDIIPSNATALGSTMGNIENKNNKSFEYEFITQGNKEYDTYSFITYISSDNLINVVATFIKKLSIGDRIISGRVFSDRNDNNYFDTGDRLFNDIEMNLLDSNKNIIATTKSNAEGYYSFNNIPKGNYYVQVKPIDYFEYQIVDKNVGKRSEANVFNKDGTTDLITKINDDLANNVLEADHINLGIRLRKSTLKVNFIDVDTNEKLAPEEVSTVFYTEKYTTAPSPLIRANYENISKTPNYEGIVDSDLIEVVYYYKLKDSRVKTLLTKVAPEEITSKDQVNKYTINYETQLKDYYGDVSITLVDQLPYEIDESLSDIAGGTYNKNKKTITWVINRKNVDASEYTQKIKAIKYISLVYKDLDPNVKTINNIVTSTIKLTNNERTNEAQDVSYVKIPGKIVVHHYLEGTTTKVAKDEVTKNIIGEVYTSEAVEKEGIILVKKPDENVHMYKEETTEVIYEYEKNGFDITTKALNSGGTIEGDEYVPYGQNSTPDNIVIETEKGYVVKQITINGESININQCKKGCVLEPFEEVLEDKHIEVSFEFDNPETSVFGKNIFIILGLFITSIIAVYKIKKYSFYKDN